MSHTQIQIAYGTSAQIAAYTPLIEELVYNTETRNIHVGDGVTAGGGRVIRNIQPDFHTRSVPTTGATTTSVTRETCRYFAHSSTIATHTIIFPPSPTKGQVFEIMLRSQITALTYTGGTGGATILGGTTLAPAGNGARFIYDSTDNLWVKVSGF